MFTILLLTIIYSIANHDSIANHYELSGYVIAMLVPDWVIITFCDGYQKALCKCMVFYGDMAKTAGNVSNYLN
ncbi:hypothetical protein BV921_01865 [Pectobacterium odoriferum]|nr:hypothetical protein BV921_01865 [Pectobacterium odoriferum]POE20350.1 hypothetical protein BV918_01375 [Pectobacterium odoriferum]